MKRFRKFCMYFSVFMSTMMLCGCPPDSDPVYSLSVSPITLELAAAANSTATFTISGKYGDDDASWTILNNTDFVNLSVNSGMGSSTITVTAREKNDGNDHSGSLIVSCGDKSQTISVTQKGVDTELMVTVENILEMTYGIACSTRYGSKVKYFYLALYETSEFNKLGNEQNIAKDIQTKSSRIFYSNYPEKIINGKFGLDYQGCIAWYTDIQPDHKYTIVAVPYDSNSNIGVISHYDVSTKSANSQPYAEPSAYTTTIKNDKIYHQWTATMSAFCNYYYTYACVGPDEFASYKRDDRGVVLAWNIMMQIPSITSDGLNVYFNKNSQSSLSHYREFIWPKMASTAQLAELEKDSKNDTYLQVVTWGFKNTGQSISNPMELINAECSGIINIMKTQISSSVTVNTLDATDVISYQAVLNGSVSDLSSSSVCGFEYGTSTTSMTSVSSGTVSNGSFSYTVTSLKPSTRYYFRAWVMDNDNKMYGEIKDFTTKVDIWNKGEFDDDHQL